MYRAVRAGVLGYMLKDAPAEELLKSIYTVASGRNWMPPIRLAVQRGLVGGFLPLPHEGRYCRFADSKEAMQKFTLYARDR